ncbi:MAG: RNase P subunit p30 family protein [Candidatus Aenigmatarchaeota archaeon]
MMIDIVPYSENINEILEALAELGYEKVIVAENFEKVKNIEEFDKKVKQLNSNIEIFSGLIFSEKNYRDLIKMKVNFRRKFDILLVKGGNLKINREAVQNSFCDFLINPFENREDIGMNHIFAKKASLNDVGIVINYNSLNFENLYEENKTYSKILEIAKLCRKYKVAFLFASFAKNKYDLKDYKFFEAFEYILGFEEKEIKENWKRVEKILEENKKKRSDKWIMPGVELV